MGRRHAVSDLDLCLGNDEVLGLQSKEATLARIVAEVDNLLEPRSHVLRKMETVNRQHTGGTQAGLIYLAAVHQLSDTDRVDAKQTVIVVKQGSSDC